MVKNQTSPPKAKNAHVHKINRIREEQCKQKIKLSNRDLINFKVCYKFYIARETLVVIKLSEMA